MEQIVANGVNHLKKALAFASATIILLPGQLMAIGDDEVLFEDDEPSSLEPVSEGGNSAFFNFDLPNNTNILLVSLAAVLAIVLGVIFYRAMLKSQVTKGVHPREFFATITFMVLGLFILGMFFILTQSGVGSLGWFTIIAGMYLFFLVVFMAMGRLRKWILVVLVLIAAIIGFQLTNMNIF